jgi:hypothetical protein
VDGGRLGGKEIWCCGFEGLRGGGEWETAEMLWIFIARVLCTV